MCYYYMIFLDEIFLNVQNLFHVKSKYIEIQQIFLFLRMEVLMYFDLHHIALKIIKWKEFQFGL